MPVRLLAGVLGAIAIIQVSAVALRLEVDRNLRSAPAILRGAGLASPAPGTVAVRLVAFEPRPPHRGVVPKLHLPGWDRDVSLDLVPAPARRAVRAALGALGSDYRWGGVSPSGFDCSGLMMWAWALGGFGLPHNSGAQYAALPRVDRDRLRPGDLLFFYSPISHVAMYVGHGLMVDAVTSRNAVVIQPVWWDSYVGAARVPLGP
ncbi:MAG: C40 family peptidase [Actinomycetota bacterium]